MARLLVQLPDGTEFQHTLEAGAACTVGRKTDNDLVLEDPHISRRHFRIHHDGQTYRLENLSRTQPTLLNDKAIDQAPLADGDLIGASALRMRFSLDDESPTRQAPGETSLRLAREDSIDSDIFFAEDKDSSSMLATSDPSEACLEAAISRSTQGGVSDTLRQRYELLQRLTREMVSQLRLGALLQFLIDKTAEIFQADHALVLLTEPGGQTLSPRAVRSREGSAARLPVSRAVVGEVMRRRVGILSADARTDQRFQSHESILHYGLRSVICVPLLFQGQLLGLIHVDRDTSDRPFQTEDLELLTMLGNQAALFVHNARLHDRIVEEETRRASLERYFSPQIARRIANGEIQLEPGGRETEVALLYSDIRGFTALSERHPAQAVLHLLSRYYDSMAGIVFEHGGTLDKFIGDAVLAVFGSPIADPLMERHAAAAALDMQRLAAQTDFGLEPLRLGIGLHRGRVIHGNLGSQNVMQFTVIGDVVNTAARLSAVAQPGQIVLSRAMQKTLGPGADCAPLGPVELRGKQKPLDTFELRALDEA